MRARTNITTKEKRQKILSNFRGVDFSKSPLHVSGTRASNAINFINENGKSKKRHGWIQIAKRLKYNGEYGRINGIFPYKNGEKQEILVYAGARFFRVYRNETEIEPEYKWELVSSSGLELKDARCQAFASGGALYIVGCGEYLKYERLGDGTWIIAPVVPYIPTTTIDINTDSMTEGVRKSHDLVNLLTGWRYNTLVGGEAGSTWQLDANRISYTDRIEIIATVRTQTDSGYTYEDRMYTNKSSADATGADDLIDTSATVVGTVNLKSGKIQLSSVDTTPEFEGENNITVKFNANRGASASERVVADSNFGVLFGIGGNADRLFVSGNARTPNVVYFSEVDNFEYFPDQYTATFGTSAQPITAMLRLSDSTLAVFKEYSANEPSVYYQSGEYRSTYNDDGDLERITPVFSITAGATLESAINPYTCCSFSGDNLILSNNGVFAIELSENLSTDARTARERSLSINSKLRAQAGLKDAVGISYGGKYFLSMDGVCYVADSLYKYQSEESQYVQYEWWYWDHIPARVFATVNNELWFGTEDGRLCKFAEAYSDATFEITEPGDLTLDFESNVIEHNPNLSFNVNDRLTVLTDHLYALYLGTDEITIKNDRIFTSAEKMNEIHEGAEVYLDGVVDPQESPYVGLMKGTPYYIVNVDRTNHSFMLADVEGATVEIIPEDTERFRLVWKVSGIETFVEPHGINRIKLKRFPEDETYIDLTDYTYVPIGEGSSVSCLDMIATIKSMIPVPAYWLTPVFDMGTNESSKTLLKLTVSTGNDSFGRLRFGYDTRISSKELSMIKERPFSFENMDFANFSFETGFWSSYSVKVKEPNFNYIRFWFLSDSDSNCTINDLTVTYKINSRNLGVR